jgi:hypothetical protein
MEGPQPSGEGLRLRQKLQVSVEVELAILKCLFERLHELAAKNFLQHFLGQEVIVSGTNPAGVIERLSNQEIVADKFLALATRRRRSQG